MWNVASSSLHAGFSVMVGPNTLICTLFSSVYPQVQWRNQMWDVETSLESRLVLFYFTCGIFKNSRTRSVNICIVLISISKRCEDNRYKTWKILIVPLLLYYMRDFQWLSYDRSYLRYSHDYPQMQWINQMEISPKSRLVLFFIICGIFSDGWAQYLQCSISISLLPILSGATRFSWLQVINDHNK